MALQAELEEQEKVEKLDAKALKAARDAEEDFQKGIRKVERAATTAANKAAKEANSKAYWDKVAANKAARIAVTVAKKAPKKSIIAIEVQESVKAVGSPAGTEGAIQPEIVTSRGRVRKIPKKFGA